MTALTDYLTNTVSTTNSTAQKALENVSTGATLTNLNTNLTAGTTGWVTLYGKGNATAQTGAGSQPALADNGWIDDATTLVGFHYIAGTWSFSLPLETTAGTITADIHVRFYQRSSGGTRTLIAEAIATGQSITSGSFLTVTGSVSGSASATYASGDTTGFDVTANITANSGGGNIRVQMANSSTLGNTSAQVVTPGYVATTTVSKKFVTRFFQYAVAQKKFVSRFKQYAVADKTFKTRFFQYDFDKRFRTRFFQYITVQKKFTSRLKQVGVSNRTFSTRFVQFDPNSTAQMLYDDLQIQYARLRASTTNTHIQLLALVYYSSTQIYSEHPVPGELDILLIGQTISQITVLKTIQDVTNFIAANP